MKLQGYKIMINSQTKSNASQQLNLDVDAWLKQNEQNKIDELPIGFTKFPDGNIPKSRPRVMETEDQRLVKEAEIKRQNEETRAKKLIISEQNKAQAKLRSAERDKERYRLKKEARKEKERLMREQWDAFLKVRVEALAKQNGVPKRPLSATEERERTMFNRTGCENAVTGKLRYYTGDCLNCGLSKFKVLAKTSRCQQCYLKTYKKDNSNDPDKLKNEQRIASNRLKRDAAYSLGLLSFTGDCRNCGDVEHIIFLRAGNLCAICNVCKRKATSKSSKRMRQTAPPSIQTVS